MTEAPKPRRPRKPKHGGKRTPGPGKRLGRPPGTGTAEPTGVLRVRVPLRVLDPFLARYGDDAPDRVRLIIESDLESTDGEREK